MSDHAGAVERLRGFADRWEARIGFGAQTGDLIYAVTVHGFDGDAELRASDLRTVLSALSASEARLRVAVEALMAAQSFIADGGHAESDPGASIYRQVTQALATIEGDG